jgi:hypothetical protein
MSISKFIDIPLLTLISNPRASISILAYTDIGYKTLILTLLIMHCKIFRGTIASELGNGAKFRDLVIEIKQKLIWPDAAQHRW